MKTNTKEIQDLVVVLDNITLQQIQKNRVNVIHRIRAFDAMKTFDKLTNFLRIPNCKTCKKVGVKTINDDCKKCQFMILTGSKCGNGINAPAWNEITEAKTPKKLLVGIKKLSKHIKLVLSIPNDSNVLKRLHKNTMLYAKKNKTNIVF